MRKPVIGVMGGSRAGPEVLDLARELGGLIARRGWILLNGGRNVGVMQASAQGAKEAGGFVVGILPDKYDTHASEHLDLAILTNAGDARNLYNVLSSDVVIACPGRLGTLSEVALALNNGRPVILLRFDSKPEFEPFRKKGLLYSVNTPQEAVETVAAVLNSHG